MQAKIYKECIINFWYFIREVIRIPGSGRNVRYKLHRGNLAMHFCQLLNINIIEVLPRQHFKTYSCCCFYTWLYLYVAKNYTIMFSNKQLEDSQLNIKRLNDLIELLPDYLKSHLDSKTDTNNINLVRINSNNNTVKSISVGRDPASADKLGRGLTAPSWWADEWAFLSYNKITFMAAKPALSTASEQSEKAGTPHGITITTTPNNLDDPSGAFCYSQIQSACNFDESWYDWDKDRIMNFIENNSGNNFVYIEFSYKQLGRDEKWLQKQIKELGGDMLIVKRELLLQWTYASSTSPFSEEQLNRVEEYVKDEFYKKITIEVNKAEYVIYFLEPLFNMFNKNYIMSCDIAGGLGRDYSAFTVIDPKTYKPVILFFNNLISLTDFSKLIEIFVKTYIPKSVIIPERNNAGLAVIENLLKSDISGNLYYEDNKDNTIEVIDREKSIFKPTKVKREKRVYGMTTGKNRDNMIEILYMIINDMPELINNKFLFDEIKSLCRNSRGKIEHQQGMHDDILMSYLIGMYIILYGKNINKFLKVITDEYNENDAYISSKANKLKEFSRFNKNDYEFEDTMSSQIIKEFQQKELISNEIEQPTNKKSSKVKNIFDLNHSL